MKSATLSVRKRFGNEGRCTRDHGASVKRRCLPPSKKRKKKREKVHTDVSTYRKFDEAPRSYRLFLRSFPLTDRPRSETERLKFQNYDAPCLSSEGIFSGQVTRSIIRFESGSMSSEIRPKYYNACQISGGAMAREKATFARPSSPLYTRVHAYRSRVVRLTNAARERQMRESASLLQVFTWNAIFTTGVHTQRDA